MSRRMRCVAMALTLFALMAASVQAVPTRVPPRESALEVRLFVDIGERLWSWLLGSAETKPGGDKLKDTSHLDPNGGNH